MPLVRLGMFDDASCPQHVPGRWLSFYLLGTKIGETFARAYVRKMGTLVFTWGDGAMVITREKGPEA